MTGPLLVALAVAAPYAWAVRRRGRGGGGARGAAFAAGALALAAAISGPLDAAADRRFSAHMVQHLVLTVVAPALLALGAPVRVTLGALGRDGRQAVGRALRNRALRALARPAVAVALASAALLVVHLTPLFGAALAHPVLHAAEHAALLWTALLAWAVVLGADPVAHRPGAIGALACLTVQMIAMAAVGAVLLGAHHVLFAHYAAWPGALADQRRAGTIMWIGGAALLVPAAVAVACRALLREEAAQRRRETLAQVRP